jgi:hypothetical protein
MESVTIPKHIYDQMVSEVEFLRCLEAAGVDNWSGYEMAQDIQEAQDA